MPDTFDVDHAFEALAHDVMGRAAPPSAVHAIKQARQRRRTTLATAVAAAAIVVAGFAVPMLVGGDDSSGVVASAGLRSLPAPAEFAPDGWEPVRDHRTAPIVSVCVAAWLDQSPSTQPLLANQAYLARGDDRLLTLFSDFGDAVGSTQQADSFAAAPSTGCAVATSTVRYADGEVQHFTGIKYGPSDLWVARFGNRVALTVATSDAAATSDQSETMADSLIAALQVPGTWTDITTDPTGSKSPYSFGNELNGSDVDYLFAGWFTNWRQSPVDRTMPCSDLTWSAPIDGTGTSPGGGVGVYSFIWPTVGEATQARETLLAQLDDCKATQWTIAKSTPTTWVATSGAGTLWIYESGESVALFTAPEGVNPPDQVVNHVTTLLAGLPEKAPY